MGDVSVLVLSGVWQSRRLTSPPRGPSELRLLIVPTDAGAANMTKRALGAELYIHYSIIVLFLHYSANTESYLSIVGRDRRKEH